MFIVWSYLYVAPHGTGPTRDSQHLYMAKAALSWGLAWVVGNTMSHNIPPNKGKKQQGKRTEHLNDFRIKIGLRF